MKGIYLLCSVFIVFSTTLGYAALLNNIPQTIEQPDGSVIKCFASGDEFSNRLHDAEGYTIMQDTVNGNYVYAVSEGNGIKPSSYIVGESNPAALGLTPGLIEDPSVLYSRRAAVEQERETQTGVRSAIGQINNLAIFIRFSDQTEFTTSKTYGAYSDEFNLTTTGATSMKAYFKAESNNTLTIDTYMYPPASGGYVVSYQDSHPRNYYAPYNATTNPIGYTTDGGTRERALLVNAVSYIESMNCVPDGLNIDANGDGNIESICFIIKGSGSGWNSILWPHNSVFGTTHVYLNGKLATSYNVEIESMFNSSVCCHEMSHTFGFTDLYHYNTMTNIHPVGSWDIMEFNAPVPQAHLVSEKFKHGGWCPEPALISAPGIYTLSPISTSPYAAYKIASNTPGQHYIVEYRKKEGTFESSVPGSGLIVYRINTARNGNTTPPDEVWIYRPGSTNNSTNGDIDNAFYSAESGRTEISSFTSPRGYLESGADGGLIITNIGSAGNTISFTLGILPSGKVWTGSSGQTWSDSANWANGVPTMIDDVVIPANCAHFPVAWSSAQCMNLKIYAGASLQISSVTLNVLGSFTSSGYISLYTSSSALVVNGNVTWGYGATAAMAFETSSIFCNGDMTFLPGSAINLANGNVNINGSNNSNIIVNSPTSLFNLKINKASPYWVSFHGGSTNDLTLNGSLTISSGAALYQGSTYNLNIKGNFTNNSGGTFALNNGTVNFTGTATQTITDAGTGCYFKNLKVSGGSAFHTDLASAIVVRGNVTIDNGYLHPNNFNITLGGDWNNLTGTTRFIEGTERIIVNGSGDQTFSTETFGVLELNKTSGSLVIPVGSTLGCTTYDWVAGSYHVDGGTFNVSDLYDYGIFGTIVLNSGTINYTQNTGQAIDLRGTLTMHGGTFNVTGGMAPAYLSYTTPATLNMDGGILDFKSVGVYIPSGTTFTDNITGGKIRTAYEFDVECTNFNPSGGIIELYGTADCILKNTAGSNFYDVQINKGTGSRSDGDENEAESHLSREGTLVPITRTNGVTGQGPLDINGNFTLQRGTFTAPPTMQIAGNWLNYTSTGFNEGAGSVEFNGTGYQYCNSESFNLLIINNTTGAFKLNPSSSVTCASYTWLSGGIEVETGTFTANDLAQNGVYGNFTVNTGGTINLYQDASSWIDIDGYLHNYGGTINIYGGSLPSDWAYAANAGITMTSGVIDFKNRGVRMPVTPYSLTMNVSGGSIYSNGGYEDSRTNVTYSGGQILLVGSGLANVTLAAGSNLSNLFINKRPATRGEGMEERQRTGERERRVEMLESHGKKYEIDYRIDGVTITSNLNIIGFLDIYAGVFDINGFTVNVGGVTSISGNFKMITSSGLLSSGHIFWNGSSTSTVSAGTFKCYGNWLFGANSAAQLTGSATQLLAASAGEITGSSENSWFGSLTIPGINGITTDNYTIDYNSLVQIYTTLNISNCSLILQSNTTLVFGTDLNLSAGAALDAGSSTGVSIIMGGNWNDYNTEYSTTTGFLAGTSLLTFAGSANQTVNISEPAFEVYRLTIDKGMSSQVSFSKPVKVMGNFDLSNGYWVDSVTGLTHEFQGNFEVGTYGTWPGGSFNTINFTGSNNQTFTYNGVAGYIYALSLNKGSTENTVTLGSSIYGLGGGNIAVNAGTLALGSNLYRTTGDITIGSAGKISLGPDATLEIADAKTLDVLSDGVFEALGTPEHLATITHQSGYYAFLIEWGATISAEYALFEYMDVNGVWLKTRAVIDATHSFHNCIFRLGAAILGSALITFSNSSVVNITNASFPINTGEGCYNAKKTVARGTINFINATGVFSGAAYEYDTYNRINWSTSSVDLAVTALTYNNANPYVCDPASITVTVRNNGSIGLIASFRVDVYLNRTSPPPAAMDGDLTHTFTGLMAGATASWTFTNVSTAVAGTWVSYAQVDPNQAISESNESNNVSNSATVIWNPIPAVTGLTASYLTSPNRTRLQWTASPISVARYKVYYDTNPYGTFSTLLASPTVTDYTDTSPDAKRFYLIKAERDLP